MEYINFRLFILVCCQAINIFAEDGEDITYSLRQTEEYAENPLIKFADSGLTQIPCNHIPEVNGLQELKLVIGRDILFRNIAIQCSLNWTIQILESLDPFKFNASQLELPRVNIILSSELMTAAVETEIYRATNLIHALVVISWKVSNIFNEINCSWYQASCKHYKYAIDNVTIKCDCKKLAPRHHFTHNRQHLNPYCNDLLCQDCCKHSTIHIAHPKVRSIFEAGFILQSCDYIPIRNYSLIARDALQGVHLVVASDDYFPFSIMYTDNGKLEMDGFCAEILRTLVQSLKFRYVMVKSVDGNWGTKDHKTGKWNGFIGMVLKKQTDFVLTGLTISKVRNEAVDFSFPFWEEPSAVVVRTYDYKASYFYKPFQILVWLGIFGCFGGATITGFTLLWLSGKIRGLSKIHYSFTEIGLIMLSTSFLQGEMPTVKGRVVRILWATLWMISLVVVTTYSGNLVAALTTRDSRLPFRTLEELAEDTQYTLRVSDGSVHHLLLSTAKRGVFAKLWDKVHAANSTVESGTAALKEMMSTPLPYAQPGDKTGIVQKLLKWGYCDWSLIPEEFFPSGFGIAFPKGTPYERLFSKELIGMAQYGLYTRWKEKHLLKSKCGLSTRYGSGSITTSHIPVFFYMCTACLGVASILLCLEIMCRKVRSSS